jgi:hypothetical protein
VDPNRVDPNKLGKPFDPIADSAFFASNVSPAAALASPLVTVTRGTATSYSGSQAYTSRK